MFFVHLYPSGGLLSSVLFSVVVRLRHIFVFVVLVAVLSAVLSCRDDGRARGVLHLADSLMEERPDSSLALLRRDSAQFMAAGEAVRMAYVLSKSEAEDKCYILHTSDSAMLSVARYFDMHGTPLQRVRSQYVLGRFYCDLRLYGHALSAFDKALAVDVGSDPAVFRYKSRAATWAGDIYEKRKLYMEALRYNKLAYEYAKRADVPVVKVYALRNIGRSYSYLKKNDVAIPYYIMAAEVAKGMDDAYLYGIVMEELAFIYVEIGSLDDAHKALSVSFCSENNINLRARYATWADYYESIGLLDSAIIYNQKALEYAEPEITRDINRDLAELYLKVGNRIEAMSHYKKYAEYADTVEHREVVEDADILSHVERKLDVERENTALERNRLHLALLLSVLIFAIVVFSFVIVRYYSKARRHMMEQQARVKDYIRQRNERESQTLKKNEEKLVELEKELSLSTEELSDMRIKLMRNEAEMLAKRNEQMKFEARHRELLMADLAETEVFKLFHDPMANPTMADYHRLSEALNKAYDNFTVRLKKFYPGITDNEMWFCCMVKAGLKAKDICRISSYIYNSLSMAKCRLYVKMFGKKGTAKDLDTFIENF